MEIKALGEDLRMESTQDIIEKGEDFTPGFFMGRFSAIVIENRDKF